MFNKQNLHTHTKYCDGKLTTEEMVIAAIKNGCESLGFSGHTYTSFDLDYCMSTENTFSYFQEIKLLKVKYSSDIELFAGIEQDYYADEFLGDVDYIIGSVHWIKKGDEFISVDGDANDFRMAAETRYSGDYYAIAEDYYRTISDVVRKTNADIVGHFDIVSKFNIDGSLFDETHPRYLDAAFSAMDEILKKHKLFEVNTRAIYHLGKPEPYPKALLLREMCKRGAEIVISSDSHEGESICSRYSEMRELLKSCGFRFIKQLTRDGFIDVPL